MMLDIAGKLKSLLKKSERESWSRRLTQMNADKPILFNLR